MIDSKVIKLIKDKNLIKEGDTIGVAVSGGADSMCLLNFLFKNRLELKCNIIAITIDHMIRGDKSAKDADFVEQFCKNKGILCFRFSVDAKHEASINNLTIEEGARQARYNVFESLLQEKRVDKIALAHHISDQAETILLHILRGSGLNGAMGMSYVRNNQYIRPFLSTTKQEIIDYNIQNNINYVNDETNKDINFSRNFLRNEVIPLLKQKWSCVEQNLINFANICREDDLFINDKINYDNVIFGNDFVKIHIDNFKQQDSLVNRLIINCLKKINLNKDIEKKHIDFIKQMQKAENGKKINLPNNLIAQKEYDFVSIYKKEKLKEQETKDFMLGEIDFNSKYKLLVETKNINDINLNFKDYAINNNNYNKTLIFDFDKLPKNCVFRSKQVGDKFIKFGSNGYKSLKKFFIDNKIPSYLRNYIPVLAFNDEIFCVLGIEISNNIKIDEKTKNVCIVKILKN